MAEACAVLWWLEDVRIRIARRGRRRRKAREGVEEGRDARIFLSCPAPWLYRPDTHNDNGNHPALSIFVSLCATVSRSSTTAPRVRVTSISSGSESKHPEEVERRLTDPRSIATLTVFVAPQCRRYTAVLQGLKEGIKRAVASRRLVVVAYERSRRGCCGQRKQS